MNAITNIRIGQSADEVTGFAYSVLKFNLVADGRALDEGLDGFQLVPDGESHLRGFDGFDAIRAQLTEWLNRRSTISVEANGENLFEFPVVHFIDSIPVILDMIEEENKERNGEDADEIVCGETNVVVRKDGTIIFSEKI